VHHRADDPELDGARELQRNHESRQTPQARTPEARMPSQAGGPRASQAECAGSREIPMHRLSGGQADQGDEQGGFGEVGVVTNAALVAFSPVLRHRWNWLYAMFFSWRAYRDPVTFPTEELAEMASSILRKRRHSPRLTTTHPPMLACDSCEIFWSRWEIIRMLCREARRYRFEGV